MAPGIGNIEIKSLIIEACTNAVDPQVTVVKSAEQKNVKRQQFPLNNFSQ